MNAHRTSLHFEPNDQSVRRTPSGLPGVDALTRGGFPYGRSTLVCGTAGAGKTVFSVQFLIEGIRKFDQTGVFVAFEETPEDIRRNMRGFGWDIAELEDAGKLAFVDGTPRADEDEKIASGDFDLGALRARIRYAIEKVEASRVSIDSLASLLQRFPNEGVIRREMFRITQMLRELKVTSLLTAERVAERGDISRFGVEEYVVGSVVVIRNLAETMRRRRTLEVLKMRGGDHATGEYPFAITRNGIKAIPLGTMTLSQPSSDKRITSGCTELDAMCNGGFFQDAVAIVSGATGTGKTLTSMHFIHGAAMDGDKAVLFAFEESRSQLIRNARGWGIDLETMEREGLIKIFCQFPESASLEEHLAQIRDVLDEFEPDRVVVDSISAMQRIGTDDAFREFVIALTSITKERQIAGLYTTTSEQLIGSQNVTGQHISTLTDTIIMLRYIEDQAQMLRAITVLKMRGSKHDKTIRQFDITDKGMQIGNPMTGTGGVFQTRGRLILDNATAHD